MAPLVKRVQVVNNHVLLNLVRASQQGLKSQRLLPRRSFARHVVMHCKSSFNLLDEGRFKWKRTIQPTLPNIASDYSLPQKAWVASNFPRTGVEDLFTLSSFGVSVYHHSASAAHKTKLTTMSF